MALGNVRFGPAFPATFMPIYGPKGASEAWEQGAQLIEHDAQLDESGSDPAANTVVGIAAEDTTTAAAAGVLVPYYPNMPNVIWVGTINISTGGYVTDGSEFLTEYGTLIDADGIHYINQADTTGPSVRVIGYLDPIGTTNSRVYFQYVDTPLFG